MVMKENVMKKPLHIKIFNLALIAAMALFAMPLSAAFADKADLPVIGPNKPDDLVNIMLGKAEMVDVGGEVSDVLVANPSIVDVMAVKSNRLYLVGASLGDTNIITLDADGNIIKKINIHVQMDTDKLVSMIHDLYPNETVEVRALTDQIVLTGDVSTPAVASRIANMVAQYAAEVQGVDATSVDSVVTNLLSVRGEQQVMLRVRIVEASRNTLKDLGIETDVGDSFGRFGATAATAAALGLASPTQLVAAALSFENDSFGPMQILARALEEEGIVNTLAEPNLTAISGEQAGFLAGGEFPIPTQLDQNGNLVYEFRPFGVSLNFRPVVLSDNRISMQMTTEVSTVTFDRNLQLQGINIPTFNVRRAETTVELPSGGTLMIAGLIQSETISGLSQVPGLGDVPVLGDLAKSDTFNRDETEVVVIITPYLVEPFAANNSAPAQMPLSPTLEQLEESMGQTGEATIAPPAPGQLKPENLQQPVIAREENNVDEIFEKNIKRTYGKNAPRKLLKETSNFGYITE